MTQSPYSPAEQNVIDTIIAEALASMGREVVYASPTTLDDMKNKIRGVVEKMIEMRREMLGP